MRTRLHGLKRPKIRMSMNKYNFYNLAQLGRAEIRGTYYQQKWKAKAAARAYHGEQIREKQWQRMFTSRIKSVIPMNFRYLATFDGSEQAAGRGSGAEKDLTQDQLPGGQQYKKTPVIPFMNMTFAPVERRLDTAIFRALFASSARQARQFVIHGGVKVNGKKMIYPGYLLNPGDMFQVDPERVLFALGAPKDIAERQATRAHRKRLRKARAAVEVSEEAEASEEAAEEAAPAAAEEPLDEAAAEKKLRKEHKDSLQSLLRDAKAVLANKALDAPSAKKKQNIRAFAAAVRRAIGNANRTATEDLDSTVAELVAKLSLADARPASEPTKPAGAVTDPSLQAQLTAQAQARGPQTVYPKYKELVAKALREIRENPIDASKAYATPWRPRPFLRAFAFIPRYLEVNHNICSAVYLRHPVARPGLAEVPTPFGAETGVLAYNWYLRRR